MCDDSARRMMGSKSDDDYWNDKYSTEPTHEKCEYSEMWYDRSADAWICYECGDEVDV